MTCYICSKGTTNSLTVAGINFGYCEAHAQIVQVGVVKYMLGGSLDNLVMSKIKHHEEVKTEFDRQREIERNLFDEDSSITEQEF